MDRVLSANDDVKSKFDQQYSREMQEAKQNLVDLYERKVEYLTERKDEQERRITKLESDLRDKSKVYEDLIFEFRQLQKNADLELGS
jgi:progesterone-induced-blocking factor 1